jgi:hypothetical protein
MRTKALVCAAVLAAGLASSMAQSNVYSLNVVGYYNVTVPQNGYFMIANQLNTTNNTLGSLIQSPSDGLTFVYKFINGGYQANSWNSYTPGWDYPGWTLNPGETAFFQDLGTPGGQTITFVGEVMQGALSNPLPAGGALGFRSSMVPQQASAVVLGIQGEDNDFMYVYNGGGYTVYDYQSYIPGWEGGNNDPNGPTLLVGQGFGYKKLTGANNAWVRNFTVQ